MDISIFDHNRAAWNQQASRTDSPWCCPVDDSALEEARRGQLKVVLTPNKPVPRDWLGALPHRDVLCLASGGGQQAPLLAAAGARVVSFDASDVQLSKDAALARRHGLDLRCEQGDMANLSRFADGSFDLIFNPSSVTYVPRVEPVWRECHRVLRHGGHLLSGFLSPLFHLLDHDAVAVEDRLRVKHRLPYSDTDHLHHGPVKARLEAGGACEFGHCLESLIGGQLHAGFLLMDLYEDWWSDDATPLNHFSPTSIATRALKPLRNRRSFL